MVKQLLLPLAGVALFIVLVGTFIKSPSKFGLENMSPSAPQATSPSNEVKIGDKTIKVTLADNKEKRTKGLSGTTSLGENEGMLFVFDSENVSPAFWMKGMLIPIDIVWINDGKIVDIDKNIQVPKSGTQDEDLELYKSDIKVDYVLEVNAGFSDKNNLKVGNDISIN